MTLEPLSTQDILRRFAPALPIVLFAFFVWWIFLTAGVDWVVTQALGHKVASVPWIMVGVIVGGLVAWIAWTVRRVRASRLVLTDTELLVRGERGLRIRQARYRLDAIRKVTLGGSLNALQELARASGQADTSFLELTKQGELTIETADGETTRFTLMNAFHPSALSAFANVLGQQVSVEVSDLHAEA